MALSASCLAPLRHLEPPRVALPAARIANIGGTTFFVVEVTPAGGSKPWDVLRRYSDFIQLRRRIGLEESDLPGVPFPPKCLFGCTGERLEARRALLEAWLRALVGTERPYRRGPGGPQPPLLVQSMSRFLAYSEMPQPDRLEDVDPHFPAPPGETDEDLQTAQEGRGLLLLAPSTSLPAEDTSVRGFKQRLSERLRQRWQWPKEKVPTEGSFPSSAPSGCQCQRAASWSLSTLPVGSPRPSPRPSVEKPHTFMAFSAEELSVEHASDVKEDGFSECARLISRDIPRTFSGNKRVDQVRLRVAEVLRSHARKDPELGYTQGMCFPAAAVCLNHDTLEEASKAFEDLMARLRGLWLPNFPMVLTSIPMFDALLREHDPEVLTHLDCIGLDLQLLLPKAWLTLFARWLPLPHLLETLPFLTVTGLPGVLAITLMLLLYHRWFLLGCTNLEEALYYLGSLSSKPPPDRLLEMSEIALPGLRARIDSLG